jgi:Trypsin-like peptidase domain
MKPIALSLGILLLCAGAVWATDRSTGPSEKPAGSGVIVHSDGYVLTAHHVVTNARRIMAVTSGEFRAPAVLVSADPEHDLALLKIDTVGLSEAPLGYAGTVRLDQEVLAVGFQFGLREVSVTRGRVAAVRTKGVQRVFQVDAAVNPGNSGGPVFNVQGEVVNCAGGDGLCRPYQLRHSLAGKHRRVRLHYDRKERQRSQGIEWKGLGPGARSNDHQDRNATGG